MNSLRRRFGYEHISEPVASRAIYWQRQLRSLSLGGALIAVSLLAGMVGYRQLVGLGWVDAYENAAMILSGMGPLAAPTSTAGKIFAGTYALYSGIAVLAITAVVAAPLVHRFLHRLHCDEGTDP